MQLMRSTASMSTAEKAVRISLMTFGFVLIGFASIECAHAMESAKFAIEQICGHIQGNLGALLMSAAGVGAVVSGAMGNFRASFALIIVGVGAFTTSSIMSLFFPDAAAICEGGAGGGGGTGGGGTGGGGTANPFGN